MALSLEYIEKLIAEFARSEKGKKAIKKKYGIEYREEVDMAELKKYGERLKEIVYVAIASEIPSFKLDDIIVGEPFKSEKMGYSIKISFNEKGLKRESLYDEYDGVQDIVMLFTKGYHARDYVYGHWYRPNMTWYGGGDFVRIRSKKDREPSDFLSKAIATFNKEAKGFAFAQLENEYKTENT